MKRLTKAPWFGPKQVLGWGWRPITWQGWLVTLVLVALLVGMLRGLGRSVLSLALAASLIGIFAVIALLTGGRPGGPGMANPIGDSPRPMGYAVPGEEEWFFGQVKERRGAATSPPPTARAVSRSSEVA
jgi:hypothetical protein